MGQAELDESICFTRCAMIIICDYIRLEKSIGVPRQSQLFACERGLRLFSMANV